MRLKAVLLWSSILLGTTLLAQSANINVNQSARSAGNGAGDAKPAEVKLTPEERKRGLRLLDSTEAAVRGMDPATQTLALVQMSKGYATSNRAKAITLLKDALRQSENIEINTDNPRMKARLKGDIQQKAVSALLQLDPDAVEKMLNEVDSDTKKVVLKALLNYYQDGKQDAKAIDMLEQLTAVQEMPYGHAATLMSRLPEEENLEFRRIFTDALNSFETYDDPKQMKMEEFATLIVKFHSKLPPELVRQAVDAVLAHAKKGDDEVISDGGTNPTLTIASSKGSAQFNSRYDYALSELYPSIVEIDPSYAEQLMKEHREAQLFLAKYPSGISGLTTGDNGQPDPNVSMMMNDGAPSRSQGGGQRGPGQGGGGGGPEGMSQVDMQRMAKIENDAAAHPADAMAQVPLLSDPAMQANAYLGIGRATVKKDSSTARSALRKAQELIPKMPVERQVNASNEAANLYRLLGDNDGAKDAINKSVDLASQVYKDDTNADDPNKAPKWYWPSTAAWRSAMTIATKMDPVWATGLLKDIPDDDIRALNQVAIASETLKIPMRLVEVILLHKDRSQMMMSQTDDQ